MKMIVGLGNPGNEYAKTKHNVGWMLVDALAEKLGATSWRTKLDADVAECRIGSEKILLVKPLTYMNESGRAVGPLIDYFKLPLEDIVVCHDDMDIPVGTLRIRKKGSAGGHNGMKSLLYHIGDDNFARVRIGIGRPPTNWTVVQHVLTPFSTEEAAKIVETIKSLIPAVECIITDGIDLAMNRYNPKKPKKVKAVAQEKAETQETGSTTPDSMEGREYAPS